ncbi:MAG: exodeoxyribonuclease VII small subunit [Candidatus Acidiferrum sp.]
MSDAVPAPSFEDNLAALEAIVGELEDGKLGLEDSLAKYEHGVGLIKQCYSKLRDAEKRILLVTGVDESGKPLLERFQLESTAPARKSRKKVEDTE